MIENGLKEHFTTNFRYAQGNSFMLVLTNRQVSKGLELKTFANLMNFWR